MTLTEDAIQEQTTKLCQAILDSPELAEHADKIEVFLADAEAKNRYIAVEERRQELHQKQHQGVQVTEEEAKAYGEMQDAMLEDSKISDFMEAQQVLNAVHQKVSAMVAKTLEMRQIPSEEDLQSGGCCGGSGGGGCGC